MGGNTDGNLLGHRKEEGKERRTGRASGRPSVEGELAALRGIYLSSSFLKNFNDGVLNHYYHNQTTSLLCGFTEYNGLKVFL